MSHRSESKLWSECPNSACVSFGSVGGGSDFEAFLEGEEEFEDGFDWSDDEEVSRFSIGIFGASHL
jgi:hypothetical protein